MPENKNRKRKPHNKYLTLTSLSFQMGVTIYLGSYIGKNLDKNNNTDKDYFTIIFVLLSVAIAMYMFIKQAKKMNNEQ